MDDRGAVRLPDWRFPGAQSVERLLASSEKAHKVANYVIGHAPRSERTRDLARKLDQQGRRLEFLRRYLDLYREYAEAELRFDDAHTLALFRGLDEDDRAGSPSTPPSSTGTTTSARCTARPSPSRSAARQGAPRAAEGAEGAGSRCWSLLRPRWFRDRR